MEWLKKRWKLAVSVGGFLLAAVGAFLARLIGRTKPRAPTGTKPPTKDDYKAVEEGLDE